MTRQKLLYSSNLLPREGVRPAAGLAAEVPSPTRTMCSCVRALNVQTYPRDLRKCKTATWGKNVISEIVWTRTALGKPRDTAGAVCCKRNGGGGDRRHCPSLTLATGRQSGADQERAWCARSCSHYNCRLCSLLSGAYPAHVCTTKGRNGITPAGIPWLQFWFVPLRRALRS